MWRALFLLISAPYVWNCNAAYSAWQLLSQCVSSGGDGRMSCFVSGEVSIKNYSAEVVTLPGPYVSIDGYGNASLDLTGTTQLFAVPNGATLALSNLDLAGVDLLATTPNMASDHFLVPRAFLLAPGSRLVLRNVTISTPSFLPFLYHRSFACQASPSPNFTVVATSLTVHLLATPATQFSDVRLVCSAAAATSAAFLPPCLATTVRSGQQLVDYLTRLPHTAASAPDRAPAFPTPAEYPIYLHVPHDISFAGVALQYQTQIVMPRAAAIPEPITSSQLIIAGPRRGSAPGSPPTSPLPATAPSSASLPATSAPEPPLGGPEVDLAWLAYALPLDKYLGRVVLRDLTLTNLPYGTAFDNPAAMHSAFVWTFDLVRSALGSASNRRLMLRNVRLRVAPEELAAWMGFTLGGSLPQLPPPLARSQCSNRISLFQPVSGSLVPGAGANGGPALLLRSAATQGALMVLENVLLTDESSRVWPGREPRCGPAGLDDPDLYECKPISTSYTGNSSSSSSSGTSSSSRPSSGANGDAASSSGVGLIATSDAASDSGGGDGSSAGSGAVGLRCECRPSRRASGGGASTPAAAAAGADADAVAVASARSHPLCALAPANLRDVTDMMALSFASGFLDPMSFTGRTAVGPPRILMKTSLTAVTAAMEDPRYSFLTWQATITLVTTLLGDPEAAVYLDFRHGAAAGIDITPDVASLTLRGMVLVNLPAAALHPAAAAAAAAAAQSVLRASGGGGISPASAVAPPPSGSGLPPGLIPTQGLPNRLLNFTSCVWPLSFDRGARPLTDTLPGGPASTVGEPGAWAYSRWAAAVDGAQYNLPRAYLESVTVVVPAAEVALLAWLMATNDTDVLTDASVALHIRRTLLERSRLAGGDAARRWLAAAVAATTPSCDSAAAGRQDGGNSSGGGGDGGGAAAIGRLTFARLEWCGLYGRNVTFATAPVCGFPAAAAAAEPLELELPVDYCRRAAAATAGGGGLAPAQVQAQEAAAGLERREEQQQQQQQQEEGPEKPPQQQQQQQQQELEPQVAWPTPFSLATSPASSSSSTGSDCSTTQSSDCNPPQGRHQVAGTVGIAVGVGIGLALLAVIAGLAGFLVWRRGPSASLPLRVEPEGREARGAGAGPFGSNGGGGGDHHHHGGGDPWVGPAAAGLSGWTSWLLGLTGEPSAGGGRYVGGISGFPGLRAGPRLSRPAGCSDSGRGGGGGGGGGAGGAVVQGSLGQSEPGWGRCSLDPSAAPADVAKDLAQLYERVDRLREGVTSAGPSQNRMMPPPPPPPPPPPAAVEQETQRQQQQQQQEPGPHERVESSVRLSPPCGVVAVAAGRVQGRVKTAVDDDPQQQEQQQQQPGAMDAVPDWLQRDHHHHHCHHGSSELSDVEGSGGAAPCAALQHGSSGGWNPANPATTGRDPRGGAEAAGQAEAEAGGGVAADKALWGIGALRVDGVLGRGAAGAVYRGQWRGLPVAVKSFLLTESPAGLADVGGPAHGASHRALQEAALSLCLSHPCIVATYTYALQPLTVAASTARRQPLPPPPPPLPLPPPLLLPVAPRNASQNLSGLESLLVTDGGGDVEGGRSFWESESAVGAERPTDRPVVVARGDTATAQPPPVGRPLAPPPPPPPPAAVQPSQPSQLRRQPAAFGPSPSQDLGGMESLLGSALQLGGGAGGVGGGVGGCSPPGARSSSPPPPGPPAAPAVEAWRLALVQEYCDGGSLRHSLRQGTLSALGTAAAAPRVQETQAAAAAAAATRTPPPPLGCVLLLALDMARGMSHLHQYGVVHGDLSSSSVLLARRPPPRQPAAAAQALARPSTATSIEGPAADRTLDCTTPYSNAARDARCYRPRESGGRGAAAAGTRGGGGDPRLQRVQPLAAASGAAKSAPGGRDRFTSSGGSGGGFGGFGGNGATGRGGCVGSGGGAAAGEALGGSGRPQRPGAEPPCGGGFRPAPAHEAALLLERYRDACGLGYVAKLCDFGLAGRLSGQDQTHLSGSVRRLSLYSAPEAARDGTLSRATDVYAFALVLWELTSGLPLPEALRAAPQLREWLLQQSAVPLPVLHPSSQQARLEQPDQLQQQPRQQQEQEQQEEQEEQLPAFAALRPELLPWPPGVPEGLVRLAAECLRDQPSERPTFPHICARLEALVMAEAAAAAAAAAAAGAGAAGAPGGP